MPVDSGISLREKTCTIPVCTVGFVIQGFGPDPANTSVVLGVWTAVAGQGETSSAKEVTRKLNARLMLLL